MGVMGLLPMVKKYSVRAHLTQFKGSYVAVDISCYLVKGLMVYIQYEPAVSYVMGLIHQLIDAGCVPVIVFDGPTPECKKAEVIRRNKARFKNQAPSNDNGGMSSSSEFGKAVELLRVKLHDERITAVFSPSEADPQCSYLAKKFNAHLIMTEDSDLIHLGCKRIIYKIRGNGWGDFFCRGKIKRLFKGTNQRSKRLDLFCSLLGNDYSKGIYGMGPKKALELVRGFNRPKAMSKDEFRKMLFKFSTNSVKKIKNNNSLFRKVKIKRTTAEFIKNYKAASFSTRHHLVLDVQDLDNLKHVPLNPILDPLSQQFVGIAGIPDNDQIRIRERAFGNITKNGKQAAFRIDPIDGQDAYPVTSLWSREYSIPNAEFVLAPTTAETPKDEPRSKNNPTCDICDKQFASFQNLRYHQAIHSNEKLHKCQICDVVFRTRYQRDRHLLEVHRNQKSVICKECGMGFKTYSYLNNHNNRIHLKIKRFECNECDEKFYDSVYLKRHNVTKHGHHKEYECFVCEKRFLTHSELNEHVDTHADGKPYTCDECGKAFKTKKCYTKHTKWVHLHGKSSVCNEDGCGKSFTTKLNLIKHVREVHRSPTLYWCEDCQRFYTTKGQHITRHGVSTYKCSFTGCQQVFGLKHRFIEHLRSHIKCEQCSLSFDSLEFLDKHLRLIHLQCRRCSDRFYMEEDITEHENCQHPDEPDHKCGRCDRIFLKRANLEQHLALSRHGDQREWGCPKCDKKFATKGGLRGHERQVHLELFQCPHCPKKVISSHSLDIHIRRLHTKNKACDKCDQVFYTKLELSNHKKASHSGKPSTHQCPVCKNMYADKLTLTRHIDDVHKANQMFQCLKCNIKYKNLKTFQKHIRNKHPIFKCNACGQGFVSEVAFRKHMEKMHPIDDSANKVFECKPCGVEYPTIAGLNRHNNNSHPNFICDKCKKGFTHEDILQQHKTKKHSNNDA